MSKRLGRYGRAVQGGEGLIEYLRVENPAAVGGIKPGARARRLSECARWLEFRKFITLPDQPVKLAQVVTCGQPFLCGFCAIQRSVRSLRFWHPRIMTALRPGVVASLVTLTAKSGPDLLERFSVMSRWLAQFWKQGDASRRGRYSRKRAISSAIGACFSFEVKRGEGTRGGDWHVHTHGVVLSEGPLDGDALAAEWCALTGQSDPRGQDVRLLKSFTRFDADDLTEAQLSESVGDDLCEVFKYPMKFAGMVPADRYGAFGSLYRRRLFRAMGLLKGLEPSPEYVEAPLQLEDLPYLRILLRYLDGGYSVQSMDLC